jgi:protein associated with RNAse G/E
LEFATEKWGGVPHYRGTVEHLGDDEFGGWWWGAKGRTIFRGDVPLYVAEIDVLFLVPTDAWWSATWWFGHPELELYVNVGTVAVHEADRIVSTDLDLDVIRLVDGTCKIVDVDEFEEHQVAYGYPQDVIDRADATASEVLDLMVRKVPPFDDVAAIAWAATAT